MASLYLILTVLIAAALGFVFTKIRVPGGMMVGALVGVCFFNVLTGKANMPVEARIAAQITAGAFIACTVEKSDLKRLRQLLKPALILLSAMLALNVLMGFVIHAVSSLDWLTSFFCAVPGGMSDIPIIATDMGANGPMVAVAQFARLVVGIGVFPSVVLNVTRNEAVTATATPTSIAQEPSLKAEPTDQGRKETGIYLKLLCTAAVAAVCGLLGRVSGVPVGTLLFSMLGVLTFKLLTDKAFLPVWVKRIAQILSGAYIGSTMTMADVTAMKGLLVPLVLLVAAYAVNCFVTGYLLHRFCKWQMREAMLAATPAGASDMALISSDLGVQSPDLIVLQVIRMLVVVTLFPQLVNVIVSVIA